MYNVIGSTCTWRSIVIVDDDMKGLSCFVPLLTLLVLWTDMFYLT